MNTFYPSTTVAVIHEKNLQATPEMYAILKQHTSSGCPHARLLNYQRNIVGLPPFPHRRYIFDPSAAAYDELRPTNENVVAVTTRY